MNPNSFPLKLDMPCGLATGLSFCHSALDAESSFFIYLDSCFRRNDYVNLFKKLSLRETEQIGGEAEANTEIPFMTEIDSASLHLF